MRFLFLLFIAPVLAGCSSDKSSNKENFSYDLTQNGCGTGEKVFSSKASMCEALKDDSQNNFCARSMRRDYFKQSNCSGNFNPSPSRTIETVTTQPPSRKVDDIEFEFDQTNVDAKFSSRSRSTVVNGNMLVTTLSGKLKTNAAGAKISDGTFTELLAPSMGVCSTFKATFGDIDENGAMDFKFEGQDDLRGGSTTDSCLKRVLTIGDVGFTAQFSNVPYKEGVLPSVTLKVRP